MSVMMAAGEKPETEEGNLTYEDAATFLGVQVSTIKQLVYREVLHPIKVSGSQHKFLSRIEVEWYDRRRRRGIVNEPNPYLEKLQQQQAAVELRALQPVEEALQLGNSSQLSDLSGLGGIAMLFLVFALLLAFIANKIPDPQKLEELRTAPEWQPVRRAILKLAGEIAA